MVDGPVLLMGLILTIASVAITWQVIAGAWPWPLLILVLTMVPVAAAWLIQARSQVTVDHDGIGGLLLGRKLTWPEIDGAWLAVGRLVVRPVDPRRALRSRHVVNILPGYPRGVLIAAVPEQDAELIEDWLINQGKAEPDPIGLH